MSATIDDVARASGLSKSTVSKVLNGYSDVSVPTREAVLSAARELRYQRSPSSTRARRSELLGAILPEAGLEAWMAKTMTGFWEEAGRHGMDVVLLNRPTGVGAVSWAEHCRRRSLEGVVALGMNFYDAGLAGLAVGSLPVITVEHRFEHCSCVQADHLNGMRLLVDHAVALGHRRIAFVRPPRVSSVVGMRIEGFRQAMTAHGLPLREDWLTEERPEAPGAALRALLSQPEPPTAVLLPDDESCLRALYIAASTGSSASFAGYGGGLAAVRADLTTIDCGCNAMGETAARLLIDAVERHARRAGSARMPVRLQEGSTLRPA